MQNRCKIVPQTDCAGLEQLKITAEEVLDGFIRLGKKFQKKKIVLQNVYPASYSESHAVDISGTQAFFRQIVQIRSLACWMQYVY